MSIYNQLIFKKAREKRFKKELSKKTCAFSGENSSCGDQITISLEIKDGIVKDAELDGKGCIISLAAANLLLEEVVGLPVLEAKNRVEGYLEDLKNDTLKTKNTNLSLLGTVSQNPVRIKCAALPARVLSHLL